MGKKRMKGVSSHVFGLILACGVCGGALAFAAGMGVDNFSQLAAGNMADLQCVGNPKDAHCQCEKGIDPKTKKCGNVPGGGKIGCPCKDVTSGDVAASGKCATVGKCKADKADGMMPMLPMLPMPMPKMSMPMMMQPNCPPKSTATSTSATSTGGVNPARTAADIGGGSSDPNCPPESFGAQSGGNFWGSVWDNVNPFSSPDDTGDDSDTGTDDDDTGTTNTNSVWGNLMKSLGISNDSDTDDTDTGGGTGTNAGATTTGGVTSKTGTSTAASTTTTQTTIDFAKTGSTFTYEAEPDEFEAEAATVLDQIKKTLEKLLDIVSKWL